MHAGSLSPLIAVLVAAGCGASGPGGGDDLPANVTCAESDLGCRCWASSFALTADESTVASCPADGERSCCYDLDSNGATSECECETYFCDGDDEQCNCYWRSDSPTTAAFAPSSCTPSGYPGVAFPTTGVCCDDGQRCQCDESGQTCVNSVQVDDCGGVDHPRSCANFGVNNLNGHAPVASCDGLTWQQ